MLITAMRQFADLLFSPQLFAVVVAAAWQRYVEARRPANSSFSLLYRVALGFSAILFTTVFSHVSDATSRTIWGASLTGYRYDIPGIVTLMILGGNSLMPKDLVIFFLEFGWIHIATRKFIEYFLRSGNVSSPAQDLHYKDLAFASALISLVMILALISWIGATLRRLKKPLAFALSCLFTAALGGIGLWKFEDHWFIAALWLAFCIIGFPLILGFMVSRSTEVLTNAQLIDMYKTGVGALPNVFKSLAGLLGVHGKAAAEPTASPGPRKRQRRPRSNTSVPNLPAEEPPGSAEFPSKDLADNNPV